ncbi:MAG: branched-chain amino acid aminotransferase [Microscillaceae bacterium]|nr:branched-chain amino acid aminotransferase [Microscillaceae bacterium]
MLTTLSISINQVARSRRDEVDFQNLVFGRTFSDHMLMAEFRDGQWQNVSIRPYGPLSFSPALMGLHYGQSIFEGMKAYRTIANQVVLFRPEENARRLNRSAQRMCMPELPEEIFIEGLRQLVALDKEWVPEAEGAALYLRPLMFASDEYVGLRPSENYTFLVMASPVAAYYAEPVRVKIETHYVRASPGGTGAAKTAGNYAASMHPARLAQQEGYHQLIWTDALTHQFVEEAGTMNVMFKIGGKIITAPTGDTILAGITRKSILQLARAWGYPLEERPLAVAEVIEAAQNTQLEEAFGVGTAAMISPIALIGYEGQHYPLAPLQKDSFALRAKQYLIDLCKGREADTFGWLTEV